MVVAIRTALSLTPSPVGAASGRPSTTSPFRGRSGSRRSVPLCNAPHASDDRVQCQSEPGLLTNRPQRQPDCLILVDAVGGERHLRRTDARNGNLANPIASDLFRTGQYDSHLFRSRPLPHVSHLRPLSTAHRHAGSLRPERAEETAPGATPIPGSGRGKEVRRGSESAEAPARHTY